MLETALQVPTNGTDDDLLLLLEVLEVLEVLESRGVGRLTPHDKAVASQQSVHISSSQPGWRI